MTAQRSSGGTARATLTIVLAGFRGGAHIREQIESIQKQTYSDWTLLVRDDGSDDDTLSIVQEMARDDDRIGWMEGGGEPLGVIGNFSRLLERALADGADWVALCDQDDVWLPEKLALQMRQAADLGDADQEPVLLHSDLSVVDEHLEPLDASLHGLMGLRHEDEAPLATLLVQNFVTGCSCLANRALLEMALPIPDEAVMSDWWLALCASAGGRLGFEPRPLVRYRQHANNVLGARPLATSLGDGLRRALSGKRRPPTEFVETLRQARALEKRLIELLASDGSNRLEPQAESLRSALDFVTHYLDLFRGDVGRARRVLDMHRRQIRRQNPILDAMLKLRLLTGSLRHPKSLSGDGWL